MKDSYSGEKKKYSSIFWVNSFSQRIVYLCGEWNSSSQQSGFHFDENLGSRITFHAKIHLESVAINYLSFRT